LGAAKQSRFRKIGLLVAVLLLGGTGTAQAQAATVPLPTWETGLPATAEDQHWVRATTVGGSHTATGLLVGGIVGVAATTVFLIGFCGDTDTECGADEVGRAVLFIAVPTAALGALIGFLIDD
jgi:hypothetical protein